MASVSLYGSSVQLSVQGVTALMGVYPAVSIPPVNILSRREFDKIARRARKRKRVYVSSISTIKDKDFKCYEGPNVNKLLGLTDRELDTEVEKHSYMQKHSLDFYLSRARRMVRKHELEDLFGTEENPIHEWPPGPSYTSVTLADRQALSSDLWVFISETTAGQAAEWIRPAEATQDGLSALLFLLLQNYLAGQRMQKQISEKLLQIRFPNRSSPVQTFRRIELLTSVHNSFRRDANLTETQQIDTLYEAMRGVERYESLISWCVNNDAQFRKLNVYEFKLQIMTNSDLSMGEPDERGSNRAPTMMTQWFLLL